MHARGTDAGPPVSLPIRLFRQFHREHAVRAFGTGRLWLVAMRTEGRVLAVFLGFRVARGGVYYQLGHDPELSSYSLGTMMVASCIRRAIEHGFAEMDFLRGADAYKLPSGEVGTARRTICRSIGGRSPIARPAPRGGSAGRSAATLRSRLGQAAGAAAQGADRDRLGNAGRGPETRSACCF